MFPIFPIHGLPETIVTENEPPLTSKEFNDLLRKNEIQYVTSQPYQPVID